MLVNDEEINVVWATDDNYAPLAGVSMFSFLKNNKDFQKINIWILDDKIGSNRKEILMKSIEGYAASLTFVNMDDYLDVIRASGISAWGEAQSYSAYSRLFIPLILKDYDVKKVLYCDCDLIIDGPLTELWHMNIENFVSGAVKEYARLEIRDLLRLDREDSYFQTGLLLMDIEKWNLQKCTDRVLWHMKNVWSSYMYADQDLINAVLNKEIFTLPPEYNVNPRAIEFTYEELCYVYGLNEKNYYTKEEFDNALKNPGTKPVVYHCSDPCGGRPWQKGNRNIFGDIWRSYYDQSLWRDNFNLRDYKPAMAAKIQYWLKTIAPTYIYKRVLKCSSKYVMKKRVNEILSGNH